MSANSETPNPKDVEFTEASYPAIGKEDAELTPEKTTSHNNSSRRGRMITAGLLATVVLALIAILVSGIFQVTSRWLIVCPQDLPVNDPAPILWQDVVEQGPRSAKLGVPDKLVSQTGFKSVADRATTRTGGN